MLEVLALGWFSEFDPSIFNISLVWVGVVILNMLLVATAGIPDLQFLGICPGFPQRLHKTGGF